ncbi:MAG: hypothetical protein R3293_22430 [Candidatus Promineifilaceae bacterium]|nr:hypothetical protein [Candidatus Promineifilaceae bacterium]
MRTFDLMSGIEFKERQPHAQSLHSNEDARALRFAFLPGQSIRAHQSPHSPIHLVVLKGQGMFAGEDGLERQCGPGMMVAFEAAEMHTVRALDEELVFISIFNGVPTTYESEHRQMVEAEDENHAHDD